MKYSELTLRYFESAPGVGVLEGPGTWRGAAGSRAQGTWVQFDIQAAAGMVRAARFLAFGCPHTIALTAWVAEQAVQQRQAVGPGARAVLPEPVLALSERFSVPIEKRGRVLIIEDAWVAALSAASR